MMLKHKASDVKRFLVGLKALILCGVWGICHLRREFLGLLGTTHAACGGR
jgi:hypothetical protein